MARTGHRPLTTSAALAFLSWALVAGACGTTGYEPPKWVPTESGGQRIFLDAKEFENALAVHLKRVNVTTWKEVEMREDLSRFELSGRKALIWIAEAGSEFEFDYAANLTERLAVFTFIKDNEIKWGERGTAAIEKEIMRYIKFDHPLVSDKKCFGFGGSWPKIDADAGDLTTSRNIAGFYCSSTGADISASKIGSFIKGIKIKGEIKE